MSEINWGIINNGATFQSLISKIIWHKDHTAKVHDRPGPDAGIDAKSGDGKTVYQVKYITNQENFSAIISKAKKEFKTIKEYRKENHGNYNLWKNVEHWCLLTNAVWSSKDEQKWKEQVKAPFEEIGLKVELRHKTILEKDLIEFPALRSEYFEGENRVLISLREAIDRFKDNIILSKGFSDESIEGRSEELARFSDFINNQDKKILCVHGPGGVGKTRFAIEAALQSNKAGYDIFWANVATMKASNNWFQSIVAGRKSLLIIDEPTDEESIKILLEQTYNSRLFNWKFVIITRTAKDYILRPLNHHISQKVAEPIEIKPLSSEESEKLFRALIEKSDKLKEYINTEPVNKLCMAIFKTSDGFPMWIATAVKLLEDTGNINKLPKDPFDLAKQYLNEFLLSPPESLNKNQFSEYLKVIAILQPINIVDDPNLYDFFKSLLENSTEAKLEDVFNILQRKKFASKRGRLLEIKPDVIRDYIIFEKIGANSAESKQWLQKILTINNLEKMKSALIQLARVAYYDRYKGVQKTFFDEIWNLLIERVEKGDLNEQFNILKIGSAISFANLMRFLELVQKIQTHKKEKPPIKRTEYLDTSNLILNLPREVYDAGKYIIEDSEAKAIFKELINLAEKEQILLKEKSYLINDGNRATQLLKELIESYDNKYELIIFEWIIEHLNKINNLNKDLITILNELAMEFLKIERTSYEMVNDNKLSINMFCILPGSKTQECIDKIFKKIWSLISANNISIESKKFLWKLLNKYQGELNNCSRRENLLEEHKKIWEKQLENNFKLLKEHISENDLDISEIENLRSIWNWNLRHDSREKFKKHAKECEDLILESNDKYNEIKTLFDNEEYYPSEQKLEEYCKKLNSEEIIHSFIDDCFKYDDKRCYDIYDGIAKILGKSIQLDSYVSSYIDTAIKRKIFDHHFRFICGIIAYQSGILRKQVNTEDALFQFLKNYWKKIKNMEQKECFLMMLFMNARPKEMGLMTKTDIEFISEILLSENSLSEKCLHAISHFSGNIIFFDFTQSKNIIKNIFEKTDDKDAHIIFNFYRHGINYRTVFSGDYPLQIQEDIFLWLVNLLLNYVPSVRLSSNLFWSDLLYLKEKKLKSKFTIKDFVDVLEKRLKLIKEKNDQSWKNIFLDDEFLKFIEQIDTSSGDTQSSMERLLNFNNHESLLHYTLPKIVAKLDPTGILIPSMIVKRIQDKKLKDIPLEYEWTRYAGYYHTNSEPWRMIAKIACNVAVTKNKQEKKHIFSSLLYHGIQTFKGGGYGEVPPYYYEQVKEAELDFDKETDPNIKEFMQWRLEGTKARLKIEIQRNQEKQEYD